jgi:WD40 repeat protein
LDDAAGIDDRSVRVWDALDGRELARKEFAALGERPVVARPSPDGRRVAVGTWSGAIAVWEWDTDHLAWLGGYSEEADDARFSADGRCVLSGSADHTLRLWEVDTGEIVAVYAGHQSTVFAHAISPDGRTIASQSTDGTLRFWPLDPLARVREMLSQLGPATTSERERIAAVLAGR